MPVPSSYNDITTDRELQYFTGWVWYEREAFVRAGMSSERVVLRIDSAHYYTMVVSEIQYCRNGVRMEKDSD
jgi:beta-glucuronidase